MDPGWSMRAFRGKIWPRHAHLFVICIAASFAKLNYCPYHTRHKAMASAEFWSWFSVMAPPPTVTFWQFQPLLHTCQRKLFIIILGIFSICLIGTYGNDRRPLVAKVDQLVAPEPVCRTISTTCIPCVNTNMFVALLIRERVKKWQNFGLSPKLVTAPPRYK